jgi:hypothetical protein
MEFRIGRYRFQVALTDRATDACACQVMDGERTDRDLALLLQAEREYRDSLWREQSILGSK